MTGRILAIDYGTKRTGLAVTDPLQIISSPLCALPTHELEDFLSRYFLKESINKVVIGYPLDNNKKPTNNTPNVKAFANRFSKLFPYIPLILHDEWGTSKMAVESMVTSNTKKKSRKNKMNVDLVSATLILQSYLFSKS